MFPNATERLDVTQWPDLYQAPTPYHNISYEVGWKRVASNVGSSPALFTADEDKVARIYSQSWYIIDEFVKLIHSQFSHHRQHGLGIWSEQVIESESVYTKLFSDWSILYLPGNPTSSTCRQTQYLFSVRSLLKQKEWTYESNLLVRNQLYDWYIHRQGWCSCFWCGKKSIAIFTYKQGEVAYYSLLEISRGR